MNFDSGLILSCLFYARTLCLVGCWTACFNVGYLINNIIVSSIPTTDLVVKSFENTDKPSKSKICSSWGNVHFVECAGKLDRKKYEPKRQHGWQLSFVIVMISRRARPLPTARVMSGECSHQQTLSTYLHFTTHCSLCLFSDTN